MISVLINNFKDFEKINFHIIEEDLSQDYKKKLISIIENYANSEIFFYPFEITVKIPSSSYPPIGYSTLFLSEFLNEDKIIYLDADTLVLNSLKDLNNYDMEKYYCGAVLDVPLPTVKEDLGFSSNDEYFNAGFLLLNLKKIREDNIYDLFLKNITKSYRFHDQDIINVCLKNKILKLPLNYNLFGYFYELNYDDVLKIFSFNSSFYSKYEIENSLKNPICTHFLNFFSDVPWRDSSNIMYENFRYFANLTPFTEKDIFQPNSFSFFKKVLHYFGKKLPSNIFSRFAIYYINYLDKK